MRYSELLVVVVVVVVFFVIAAELTSTVYVDHNKHQNICLVGR